MIQTKIDQAIMELAKRDAYVLRMSGAGACERQIDYDLQMETVQLDFAGAKRTAAGKFMHDFWREIFTRAFGPDFVHAEAEISIPIVVGERVTTVYGHPDGVLHFEGAKYLVEFKSVSENTYAMVINQDHAIAEHLDQGNCYADVMECDSVLMVYINRNSGDYQCFIYDRSKAMAQGIKDKWARAIARQDQFKATGQLTLSPRPYQDPTCSPCFFCSRNALCYEGFPKEVKDAGKGPVPKEAESDVREFLKMRTDRLRLEKSEDQKKTQVVKFLLDSKLNTAYLETTQLTITLGKTNNPILKVKEGKSE